MIHHLCVLDDIDQRRPETTSVLYDGTAAVLPCIIHGHLNQQLAGVVVLVQTCGRQGP